MTVGPPPKGGTPVTRRSVKQVQARGRSRLVRIPYVEGLQRLTHVDDVIRGFPGRFAGFLEDEVLKLATEHPRIQDVFSKPFFSTVRSNNRGPGLNNLTRQRVCRRLTNSNNVEYVVHLSRGRELNPDRMYTNKLSN